MITSNDILLTIPLIYELHKEKQKFHQEYSDFI